MSIETIVRFGPQGRLTGILSGKAQEPSTPILVLPNAGMVPRAGLFRLHVEMSRRFDMQTFRFDLPGVGEAPRISGCDHRRATLAAFDRLSAQLGCNRFIVGGVCSAADLGWRTAVDDTRVAGLLLLDGVTFAGPWFHLVRIAKLMRRSPLQWPGVALRLLKRSRTEQPALVANDYRDWPSRVEARQQMAVLVARNVHLLCIYTGGVSDRFLHPREFHWAFGDAARSDVITLEHWPDCDHAFYTRAHRDRLLDTVAGWLRTRFAAPGGGL